MQRLQERFISHNPKQLHPLPSAKAVRDFTFLYQHRDDKYLISELLQNLVQGQPCFPLSKLLMVESPGNANNDRIGFS